MTHTPHEGPGADDTAPVNPKTSPATEPDTDEPPTEASPDASEVDDDDIDDTGTSPHQEA